MPGQLTFQNVTPPNGGGHKLMVRLIKVSPNVHSNQPVNVTQTHRGENQRQRPNIKRR